MNIKKISTLRRNVRVQVILRNGFRRRRILGPEPGGTGFIELNATLSAEREYVESCFPGKSFKLVPLTDGSFNFVEIKAAATA